MKKILVIDDDKFFPITIKEALDPEKYEVQTASDGIEGLAAVEASRPDVILLDINMPNMNGIQFLTEMNSKLGPDDPIPVIITSNLSGTNDISQGIALGVRGYIVKSNESLSTIGTTIDNLFK